MKTHILYKCPDCNHWHFHDCTRLEIMILMSRAELLDLPCTVIYNPKHIQDLTDRNDAVYEAWYNHVRPMYYERKSILN